MGLLSIALVGEAKGRSTYIIDAAPSLVVGVGVIGGWVCERMDG
jgi:hypothetical protein